MKQVARLGRRALTTAFFLASALLVVFPGYSSGGSSLTVSGTSSCLQIRPPGSLSFVAVASDSSFPLGTTIRLSRNTSEAASIPIMVSYPASGPQIQLFPGSVLGLFENRIKPIFGRAHITLIASGDAVQITPPPPAVIEIQGGECWVEVEGDGPTTLALMKGTGWVKTSERKIVRMSAGKQIRIDRKGVAEKVREVDSRWKQKDYQGFAPIPDLKAKPPTIDIASPTEDPEDGDESIPSDAISESPGKTPETPDELAPLAASYPAMAPSSPPVFFSPTASPGTPLPETSETKGIAQPKQP